MNRDDEIETFLRRHLQSVQDNDTNAYKDTTAEDLTLYEWWITPHRIDGLPFHEFMMASNARAGTVFGAEAEKAAHTRFDLSNLRIQRYGETAIASYTLLISTATEGGARVAAHSESRVMVNGENGWKVVHVHKSPAWPAPHISPGQN